MTENPPDSQERVIPQEFEVRLRHSRSIEEQVINTIQDQDLIQEREEAKQIKEEEIHKKDLEDHPEPEATKLSPKEEITSETKIEQ